MKELAVKVEKNEKIAEGIFRLVLRLPEAVPVRCGQFLNLSVGDGAHLLRRPFAVCRSEGEEVSVCYQLKGEGTHILSRAKAGDALSCVLPLGNGFTVGEEQKRVALVGGGVGVFPMLSVLYEYAGKGKQLFSFIGFRNRGAVCCEEEFRSLSDGCMLVTDDGSFGKKGNAVSAFFEKYAEVQPDVILACGPVPMLRALKAGIKEHGISVPCYVSLEERMGCGIGACLVCVCRTQDGKGNRRVCKDGPVFDIDEVEI